jgi:hypothetical protein
MDGPRAGNSSLREFQEFRLRPPEFIKDIRRAQAELGLKQANATMEAILGTVSLRLKCIGCVGVCP